MNLKMWSLSILENCTNRVLNNYIIVEKKECAYLVNHPVYYHRVGRVARLRYIHAVHWQRRRD